MSAVRRGIEAAAVYIPRFRLPMSEQRAVWNSVRAPGVESVAVPAADEDALTMAVAASERVLAGRGPATEPVSSVALATTTPPAAEGALASRLARALDLEDRVATADLGGDILAGAAALDRALDADGPTLVAIADLPPGDPGAEGHRLGAGAAAFLVEDDAAVPVLGRAWHGDEYPGVRYRPTAGELEGLGVRNYERAAVHESVSLAFERLDTDPDGIRAAALHQPNAGAPHRLGGVIGLSEEAVAAGTVADRIGDTGAAGVPIGIGAAIDGQAPDALALAGFAGSEGGGAVFLFEGGLAVSGLHALEEGVTIDHSMAMRLRGEYGEAEIAGGGAYVSLPTWRRTLPQRYHLEAGRCLACDGMAFPSEGACPDCGARDGYEPEKLERSGIVVALTVIGEGAAPPEFAELQRRSGPFATAIVECQATNGGQARLPAMMTDTDPSAVETGDQVRATFRRLYEQEGITRYGLKFAPEGE